ncbi:replication protein A 70 kDa DNA-binding subunit D-like isoform X2 [Phragmites australis]|uniref:replication protein A 70 kDa DNA-binding subunit D-like isoform X2 n=1 Tax=Phragmites australis TaxID=29695 RepID=UPI002D77B2AB|nr:replication protein A 70 kDa DNA-binding subunit D-like isoform X2 [Phragmites australis]
MPFDLLPTLHPKSKHWTICARVSRKWEYRGGTDDGPIAHIDLVLIDEQGNAIYAEIPNSEIERKDPLLQEGGIYVMSRFRVSNSKTLYRPVDAPYMIEFTCYTKITPARDPPETFPRYVYKLTPFLELPHYTGENKNFLDVIGIVTEVSDTSLIQLANRSTPTVSRHIMLKDLNNVEVKLTLWGQRATQFTIDEIYNEQQATPVVILVVGNLMKTFAGEEYLSGNAACHWYFNPSIPEAEPFYNTIQNQQLVIKRTAASTQQPPSTLKPIQVEDKQLQDLETMNPYDFPENGCRCTVTITRLVQTTAWWFASCNKCSRACTPDGPGYKCTTCSCTGYRFKYKLCFVANDGTAEAEMVAFGEVGRRIVGKPVQQVLRATRIGNDIPPDIAAIVSLKFTFAITLTNQSYYSPKKSYQVNSIIAAYGRQHTLPQLRNNQNKGLLNPQMTIHSSTQQESLMSKPSIHADTHHIDPYASPPAATPPSASKSTTTSTPSDTQRTATGNTLPPLLDYTESVSKKSQLWDAADASSHSGAKRKLFRESPDATKETNISYKKSKTSNARLTDDPQPQSTSKKTSSHQVTSPDSKPSEPKVDEAQ